MDTRDALYRAVLDEPADDTRRLVYADCLEETGRPKDAARAEFVRLQVDRARGGFAQLGEREAALLRTWGNGWMPRWFRSHSGWSDVGVADDGAEMTTRVSSDTIEETVVFRRGLVAGLRLCLAVEPDPCKLGELVQQVFAAHPLEAFRLEVLGHTPAVRWRATNSERDDFQPTLHPPGWHQRIGGTVASAPIQRRGPYPSRRELCADVVDCVAIYLRDVRFTPDPDSPPF